LRAGQRHARCRPPVNKRIGFNSFLARFRVHLKALMSLSNAVRAFDNSRVRPLVSPVKLPKLDQVGKVFLVVDGMRKCLVCEAVLNRNQAAKHAIVPCQASAAQTEAPRCK
jgi:hypothetical protein